MDINHHGVVTKDEFKKICQENELYSIDSE